MATQNERGIGWFLRQACAEMHSSKSVSGFAKLTRFIVFKSHLRITDDIGQAVNK